MRIFRFFILAFLVFAVVVIAGVYMFADRIIFQPPTASYKDTSQILKLTTANGEKISAIYLPNESATYTILFSHGNAEDLGTVRYKLEELREMGFAVLGYDYRGYGTSEGRPSEENAYRDIDAAFEYLVRERSVPAERIILHGWSLGGAVAADLAARQKVGGLILESTFISAFRVVTRAPILPFDQFRTLSKLQRIDCPVLVIHGTDDEVIQFWHGQMLYDKARDPKHHLWIDHGRHGDLSMIAGGKYARTLREFSDSLRR